MAVQRVITALVGIPLIAVLLIFGNKYIVDIAFAIIAIIAMREYFNGFSKKTKPVREIRISSCNTNCLHTYSNKKSVFCNFNCFNTSFYGYNVYKSINDRYENIS